MAKTKTAIDYAMDLKEELLSCGHDDISHLDILDALASTGLTLVPAVGAGESYIEALGVKVIS